MTDSESPIIDFYPTSFEIDMNGKKMTWQGVALLPFIDENRLLESMQPRYPKLTEAEVERNKWGSNLLFVSDGHALYPSLEALYGKKKSQQVRTVFSYPRLLTAAYGIPACTSGLPSKQGHKRILPAKPRLYTWFDILLSVGFARSP